MAITKEIREALDLKNLDVPPALKVQSLDVEEYEDWFGDPSLRSLVIIDDSVDEFKISGKDVIRFERSMHENLLARGVSLFPFVSFAKPSELAAEESGE